MKSRWIRRAVAMALALIMTLPLTAPARAADEDLKITSDKTGDLQINETATLTANWTGEGKLSNHKWTMANSSVAELVPDEKEPTKATVTAKTTGSVIVTFEATSADDAPVTATYELTVMPISLTIVGGNTILWTKDSDRTLSAYLSGIIDEDQEITWSALAVPGQAGVMEPTFSVVGSSAEGKNPSEGTGAAVAVNEKTAGVFDITAAYQYDGQTYAYTTRLTISGLVLSGEKLDTETQTLPMVVGGSATLTATAYGAADDYGATEVEWFSDDSAVVSVMLNGGNLNAWGLGTTVVRAVKGDYSAECTVEVDEDQSVITQKKYTASVSDPLTLDVVYGELDDICFEKTGAYLRYITNLKVTFTDQGTLYYNYSTDSDTGDGAGYTDQFSDSPVGSVRSVRKLSFVPKQGFSGTAEITFTGIATNGQNFAGIIRVEVGSGGSGGWGAPISYRTKAGEPVWFQADDFSTFCLQSESSRRDFNYITFTLPKSSEGVLYYNYVAGSGNLVTPTDRFAKTGRYTANDVCFVPNAAAAGQSVRIPFRAVDTAGDVVNGTLTVFVDAAETSDSRSSVWISGERGRPVPLVSSLFNDACQKTLSINDTLSFVTFTLPDPDVGTLYVNYRSEDDYGSRVTTGTRCYYSGVPGISSISFVPASGTAGRVAIPYTGYSTGGASFSGTLYIELAGENRTEIHYSVPKGGSVTFNASDFYNAALYQKGVALDYVEFDVDDITNDELGTLYYNYRSSSRYNTPVYSWNSYYYSPRYSSQSRLSLISFHAEDGAVGTVRIPYTAYCGTGTNQQTFTGEVVIQVSSRTPSDVNLSCRTGGQVSMSAAVLNSVCSAAMSGNLSYIEITSLPDPEQGHLYYGYSGFGTGTAVKQGDRFYRVGLPGISQITFVPFSRFTGGKAEITYIGYGTNGLEQVSGRIVINVSSSTASQYFNDMGDHTWAIDSVDYLRRNGTVIGIGDGRYDPGGRVTKGDFTLMLVRAYGLSASGSASFKDVPADSYYADAIRIAALLGVAGGSNGNYNPDTPLSRQDAIVMIYNTLRVSGKTTTNGLAADLSVFYDERQIASYAREAIGSLVQMGVVKGDGDGYLRPRDLLNRAEAAVLLHTIMTL